MIGLLVLGPEKLPRLAAKLGHWMGRARSIARQLHTQLEQEVLLEEERQRRKEEAARPVPTPASAGEPVMPTGTPEHSVPTQMPEVAPTDEGAAAAETSAPGAAPQRAAHPHE
jgi:sec-independent protein translocase protein TatB